MPLRRLNNFVFCPRLFYFQWVENIFQESADTVAGSLKHRNVDAPSRLDEEKAKALPGGLARHCQTRRGSGVVCVARSHGKRRQSEH
jgi:CRISPR-associated protein Cas1